MRGLLRTSLLIFGLVGLVNPVGAQSERRDRWEPELVLETGGRMAACDDLRFTPDGKHVVAVGDDKVARIWAYNAEKGTLDETTVRVLRWDIWREQRGSIYAMALAPHGEGLKIALGGVGARTSTVSVLDFQNGNMLHTVNAFNKAETKVEFSSIRAVDFAPDGESIAFGTSDGSIWLWDFEKHERLGTHGKHKAGSKLNYVRLARFLGKNHLLTVSDSGGVVEWSWVSKDDKLEKKINNFWKMEVGSIARAALSPNKTWVAAASKSERIALRTIDNKSKNDFRLAQGEFGNAVTFSPDGKQLAIAVGHLVKAPFFVDGDDRIVVYDLTQRPPQKVTSFPHRFRVDRLTYSPDGKHLLVAGGSNHEVTVWNLGNNKKPTDIVQSAGETIWDVALSKKGDQIGYRVHRNPSSADINDRAITEGQQGEWKVFDLFRRVPADPKKFDPVQNINTLGGWTVAQDPKEPRDPYQWIVVHPQFGQFPLPHDKDLYGMPRCYTFLKANKQNPIRLVVGHYWGASVFELGRTGPRLVNLCVGHAGEVMAIGVSEDQSWMVTAGLDQTIAAWRLNHKWKHHPVLGAKFEAVGDHLKVVEVEVGSPAWEAGLLKDDEVIQYAYEGVQNSTDPRMWLKTIDRAIPRIQNYFKVRRKGTPKPVQVATMSKTRPLWRFFPTRQREWVLWMWQNRFYDSSTRGDFYLGWQLNKLDTEKAPTFYRAEQLRKHYRKNGVLDKLLETRDPQKAVALLGQDLRPNRFDRNQPPEVAVKVGELVPGVGYKATLQATLRGTNPDFELKMAELWINDYRVAKDPKVLGWKRNGKTYVKEVTIPENKLRAGRNVVTLQVFNRLDWRSENSQELTRTVIGAKRSQMWRLAVGINSYKGHQTKVAGRAGTRALGDLNSAVNDATLIHSALKDNGVYDTANAGLQLDKSANRKAILRYLEEMAEKSGPEDMVVLFFAGHGMNYAIDPKDPSKGSSFVFCCPDFDPDDPRGTGISSEELADKLANIPGRKLVILDACHSGVAVANPVRALTPGGQGPIILAACDPAQQSFEDGKLKIESYQYPKDQPNKGHGLFTFALLEALTDKKKEADFDEDGFLDTEELMGYAEERVPELLFQMKRPIVLQTPIMFAPDGQKPYRLARLEK